jgi:hypothetical protein
MLQALGLALQSNITFLLLSFFGASAPDSMGFPQAPSEAVTKASPKCDIRYMQFWRYPICAVAGGFGPPARLAIRP